MATVIRGYKTELDLNNAQRTACLKHAGCARFAYNWGLARSQEVYRTTGRRPTTIDLHKELVTLKKTVYPWMYEVSKFKKKSRAVGSFRFPDGKKIHVFADAIQLPRLGRLRLHEHGYLPTNARVLSATVYERAGRWYVSVQVEEEREKPAPTATTVIGVDLGIKELATLSDGTTFANPRALKRAQKKLRRVARAIARRKNGSTDTENACGQESAGMLNGACETALDEAGTKSGRVARLPMTTF